MGFVILSLFLAAPPSSAVEPSAKEPPAFVDPDDEGDEVGANRPHKNKLHDEAKQRAFDDDAVFTMPSDSGREYRRCLALADKGSLAAAGECMKTLAQKPRDRFTLQARGARDAFSRTAPGSALAPPGRLELTSIAGLFGAWNGIAIGTVMTINTNAGGAGVLFTGGLALGLGVGLGFAGYALAEGMALAEGEARLIASGIVWGTILGTEMLAVTGGSPAGLLAIVGTGWLGGGAGFFLAKTLGLDAAQVSLMNSGGALGTLLGSLVFANFQAAGVRSPVVFLVTMSTTTMIGLGLGVAVGKSFDFTWGETLFVDLGGALGLVLGSTIAFAAAPLLVTDLASATAFVAVAVGGGTLLGAVCAGTIVQLTRRTTTDGKQAIRLPTLTPTVVLDSKNRPQPALALQGTF